MTNQMFPEFYFYLIQFLSGLHSGVAPLKAYQN